MDAPTFDRFLELLDAHWTDPSRLDRVAAELSEWCEAEARRAGYRGPTRRFVSKNLAYLCGNALGRFSIK
jgi:hypothetical protein